MEIWVSKSMQQHILHSEVYSKSRLYPWEYVF